MCGRVPEVDELRAALELATEEELCELTDLLFRPKFNPLDYMNKLDPLEIQSLPYDVWLDALEARFRFLGADGVTVLQRQTHQVSYRRILIQVCRHLRLPYQDTLSTTDLEAEIFLYLLQRAWQKLSPSEQVQLNQGVKQAIAHTDLAQTLPESLRQDPMRILLKGGSAIALNSVLQPVVLELIARQFALHFARYQVAQTTLGQGGLAVASQFQSHMTSKLAQHGMAMTAARYGAVRSLFAVFSSALWAWFLADLGWRTIATNYARIIPTVFALAQIRLTRHVSLEAV